MENFRKVRHAAIATYAVEMAGSNLDLDADLESAAIEYLTTFEIEISVPLAAGFRNRGPACGIERNAERSESVCKGASDPAVTGAAGTAITAR